MTVITLLTKWGPMFGYSYKDFEVGAYILIGCNGIANFFLYTINVPEIKHGVKLLFKLKQFNPNAPQSQSTTAHKTLRRQTVARRTEN